MGRVALILVLAATARAQSVRAYTDEAETVSIHLPAAWQVVPMERTEGALALRVKVESGAYVDITVYVLDGVLLSARAQALFEREPSRARYRAKRVTYGSAPLPHLLIECNGKGTNTILATYRRRRCRGIHTKFALPRDALPGVEPALLAAGASASTSLDRWPAVEPPEDYKRSEKDGLVYLAAPEVDRTGLRRVQRELRDLERWFEKSHGRIPRPADEPPIVYVHPGRVSVTHLCPDVILSRQGNMSVPRARMLFASTFPDDEADGRFDLIDEAWGLYFREVYGDNLPAWVYYGERVLYRNELRCGKRAPAVPESFQRRYTGVSVTLDRIAAPDEKLSDDDWDAFWVHAALYCMFFREGPSKYTKAYATYLEHIRTTGDVADAYRHLRVFDMAALREEVATWIPRHVKVISR